MRRPCFVCRRIDPEGVRFDLGVRTYEAKVRVDLQVAPGTTAEFWICELCRYLYTEDLEFHTKVSLMAMKSGGVSP